MSNREQLLVQAEELGLEFPKNVKTEKLQTMINEELGVAPASNTETAAEKPKKLSLRERVKAAKDKALKTSIVTITNKDNRENDVMTTVHLSFENQYFGLSKIIPLDMPVELEQALIDLAESTMITLHKDEIIDGRRTGNKIPVTVKKFAISYSKTQPK